ncbi:glycosyltransferase family A protein [Enterococcus faecium]
MKKLYESLLNQTSKGFEWLIVDDGSTDKTKEFFFYY